MVPGPEDPQSCVDCITGADIYRHRNRILAGVDRAAPVIDKYNPYRPLVQAIEGCFGFSLRRGEASKPGCRDLAVEGVLALPVARAPGSAVKVLPALPRSVRSIRRGRPAGRGAGGFCSFSAETKVLMADRTTKNIADIEVGDRVLAQDPETGERGARTVTKLWVHQDQLVDLGIDGEVVATTEDHPFWNHSDQAWQEAEDLDFGDLVLTADGELLAVDGLKPFTERQGTAYNLTVADIHTFFVVVGEDEVLVHNVCGDDRVSEILRGKKGSIRNAPLPKGSPSWDDLLGKTFAEIEAGAKAGLPGYRTIRKLLTDRRFDR